MSAFHLNLLAQIEAKGWTPRQFWSEMRRAGTKGVHGSYVTFKRWIEGNGDPPDYWVERAAGLLEIPVTELRSPSKSPGGRKRQKPEAPRDPEPEAIQRRRRQAPRPPTPPEPELPGDPLGMAMTEGATRKRPWLSEQQVWDANAPTLLDHLAAVEDPAEVDYIREIEKRNPNFKQSQGRVGVMRFADRRYVTLTTPANQPPAEEKKDEEQQEGGETEG